MGWAKPLVASQVCEPASPKHQLQSASLQNGLGSSQSVGPRDSSRHQSLVQVAKLLPPELVDFVSANTNEMIHSFIQEISALLPSPVVRMRAP
jgi:hypothetical protein